MLAREGMRFDPVIPSSNWSNRLSEFLLDVGEVGRVSAIGSLSPRHDQPVGFPVSVLPGSSAHLVALPAQKGCSSVSPPRSFTALDHFFPFYVTFDPMV